MKKANVRWECADTFNPAAVVKDGKVCVRVGEVAEVEDLLDAEGYSAVCESEA